MNSKPAAGVCPLNIVKNMADNSTGATLHAPFVGEEDVTIGKGAVAGCGTAVYALLTLALQTYFMINNSYVRSGRIDIVGIEAKFAFNCRGVQNATS